MPASSEPANAAMTIAFTGNRRTFSSGKAVTAMR
jgi:hypothetical protein